MLVICGSPTLLWAPARPVEGPLGRVVCGQRNSETHGKPEKTGKDRRMDMLFFQFTGHALQVNSCTPLVKSERAMRPQMLIRDNYVHL